MTNKVRNILEKVKSKEIVRKEETDEVFYEFEENESLDDFTNKYKETKFNVFKNYFSIPALIIHEFLHILVSFILFRKVVGVSTSSPKKKNFHTIVSYENFDKSFIRTLLIGIAPIFSLFTFIGLCFVSSWFIIPLVYLLISIKTVLPSKLDIVNILLHKYLKEFEDEKDFGLFTEVCYEELKLKDLI